MYSSSRACRRRAAAAIIAIAVFAYGPKPVFAYGAGSSFGYIYDGISAAVASFVRSFESGISYWARGDAPASAGLAVLGGEDAEDGARAGSEAPFAGAGSAELAPGPAAAPTQVPTGRSQSEFNQLTAQALSLMERTLASLSSRVDSLASSKVTYSRVGSEADAAASERLSAQAYVWDATTLRDDLIAFVRLQTDRDRRSSSEALSEAKDELEERISALELGGSLDNPTVTGLLTGDAGQFSGDVSIGGDLSVAGDLNVTGAQVLSGAIGASYFTASDAAATSTFQWLSATRSSIGTVLGGIWQGSPIADSYLTKTGDWTGTLDGREGSYYLDYNNLANRPASFGTSSADYWLGTKTTADIAEGSRLYYTDTRVGSYITGSTTLASYLNYWSKTGTDVGYASGNVGIGIASPTSKLDVYGGGTVAVSVRTVGSGSETAAVKFYTNGTVPRGTVGWDGTVGGLHIKNDDNSSIFFGTYTTATSMVLTDFGRLGVGTTSPFRRLSVMGDAFVAGDLRVSSLTSTSTATSTFGGGIDLSSGCFAVNGVCLGGNTGSGTVSAGMEGQVAIYEADGDTVAGTSSVRVLQNGYVGVGMNPTQKLSVSGSLLLSSGNLVFGSSQASFTIGSSNSNGTINIFPGVNNRGGEINIAGGGASSNAGTVIFRTGTGSGQQPEVARLDASGRFGIGTTSPYARLSVAGEVVASHFTGTTTATSTLGGDLLVTGNIVPSADNTYSLGSASSMWRDVYIGPGSLYVNGKKVIEESAQTMVFSADTNQNVSVQTLGSGDIELNALGSGLIQLKSNVELTAGKTFRASDGSAIDFSDGLAGGNISVADNLISATNVNGGIEFRPNGLGASYFTAGNVGIGTTSPLSKLSVSGGASIGADYNIAAPANGLIVQGNVGIGTSTPSQNLSVIGSFRAMSPSGLGFIDFDGGNGPTFAINAAIGNAAYFNMGYGGSGRLSIITGNTGISFNTYNGGAFKEIFSIPITGDSTNGSIGFGSSTPFASFAVQGVNGNTRDIFQVASSTGAVALSVNAAGNVGIGTTTPSTKLSVSGYVTLTGIEFTNTGNTGIYAATDYVASWNKFRTDAAGAANIPSIGVGGTNQGLFSSSGALGFSTAQTERMRITSGGNVGIGSSSPAAKLTVKGAGTGSGAAFQITNSSDAVKFTLQDNGLAAFGTGILGSGSNSIVNIRGGTGSGSALTLYDGDNPLYYAQIWNTANGFTIQPFLAGGSYQSITMDGGEFRVNAGPYGGHFEAMRVASSGNVGIGTTTPSAKLTVLSTTQDSGTASQFVVGNTTNFKVSILAYNGAYGGLTMGSHFDGANWIAGASSVSSVYNGVDGFRINVNGGLTAGGTYAPETKLFISSTNGNMAIGTTSPDATLMIQSPAAALGRAFAVKSYGGTDLLALTDDSNGYGYHALTLTGNTNGQAVGPLVVKSTAAGTIGTALTLDATASGGKSLSFISTGPTASAGAGAFAIYNGTDNRYDWAMLPSGHMNFARGVFSDLAQVTIVPTASDVRGLYVEGKSGQTANLLGIGRSDGTLLSFIDENGYFGYGNVGEPKAPIHLATSTGISANGTQMFMISAPHEPSTVGSGGKIAFTAVSDSDPVAAIRSYTWGSGLTGLAFDTGYDNPLARMVIDNGGNVGIGTTSPSARLALTQSSNAAAGGLWLAESGNTDFRSAYMDTSGVLSFFGGDTSGTLNTATLNSAGEWTNASDMSYKEHVGDLAYGLDAVRLLKPRSYLMKGTDYERVGFIAQEVELVIPEVVSGREGSKGISYGNLVAVVVKAVQELDEKVEGVVGWFRGDSFQVMGDVCVDDVCVTRDEFKVMIMQAKQPAAVGASTGAAEQVTPAEPSATEADGGFGNGSATAGENGPVQPDAAEILPTTDAENGQDNRDGETTGTASGDAALDALNPASGTVELPGDTGREGALHDAENEREIEQPGAPVTETALSN